MFNERTNENANELNTTRQYSISKAGLFAKTLVGLVHVDDMLTSFVKFKKICTTIRKFLIFTACWGHFSLMIPTSLFSKIRYGNYNLKYYHFLISPTP